MIDRNVIGGVKATTHMTWFFIHNHASIRAKLTNVAEYNCKHEKESLMSTQ